eukprot:jgi/Botrbrau1/20794/Bobra.0156s0024.1
MDVLRCSSGLASSSHRPIVVQVGLTHAASGRGRGSAVSSRDAAAETSSRLLTPDFGRLVRPLELTSPAAPSIRNKRLNINHEGIRPSPHVKRSQSRLKVAVDVDEVLGRFLHSLNKFCFEAYGLNHDISDYFVYEFAKIWKCSQDKSNEIVHEFFDSHHFAVGILPIPGAYHSLLRLKRYCDLVVVTSRQHVIEEPTLAWIDLHFPGVFHEVHFGNHWAKEGKSRPKSEICRDIGASVLIDDNPRYAVECAGAGMHVLLYDWDNNYPWSKTEDGPTHDQITRVSDWIDVEDKLALLHASTQGLN